MTLSGSLALFGLFLVKLGNGLFQFIKAKHGGVCHEKAQDHSAHHRVPVSYTHLTLPTILRV